MAKRSAEKQLTKDSRSDDEDDSGDQTGFRRADEKTLSGRVIRGMPRRAGGTPTASPGPGSSSVVATPGTPTPPPKFAGFGSFPSASGGEASGSTTSFGAKTVPDLKNFPFPPAKVSSEEPKARFMNFATANPTPPATPSSDGSDEDLFKYYSQLRGLNVAIMESCKKALQADPFMDLSQFFKQYSEHRSSIEKSRTPATKPAASTVKAINGTAPASASTTSSDIPKPPAVPTSFSFSPFPSATLSAPKPPTAPSAPPSFAPFVPPSTSTSSSAPAESSTTTAPAATTDSPAKSAFSFAAPASKSTFSFGAPASTDDKGTKSAFSFGAPSSSSGWPPAPSSDAAKGTETKPVSSLFGASPSAFGSSSLFSSPSTTPAAGDAGSSSSTSPAAKPAFSFGFGSGSSPFAPNKGSLGNPVGFSFGAPSKSAESESAGSGAEEHSSQDASQGGEAAENVPIALEPSAYDKEGAGEEDEETNFEERCKAYRLEKKDGGVEWVDLGVGMLRCKKHKTTDVRRVLMRGSGTGRIVLNFVVFPSLKPTQQKNVVSFVAMDGGEPASFRLRVKNEAQAIALKNALVKEAEAVAAKKSK